MTRCRHGFPAAGQAAVAPSRTHPARNIQFIQKTFNQRIQIQTHQRQALASSARSCNHNLLTTRTFDMLLPDTTPESCNLSHSHAPSRVLAANSGKKIHDSFASRFGPCRHRCPAAGQAAIAPSLSHPARNDQIIHTIQNKFVTNKNSPTMAFNHSSAGPRLHPLDPATTTC